MTQRCPGCHVSSPNEGNHDDCCRRSVYKRYYCTMSTKQESVAAEAVDENPKAVPLRNSTKSGHKSQGGPTTEAGRLKEEEAQAAKIAKLERKRERNRKKRQAYRARKNAATQFPKGASQWKKNTRPKKKEEETKEERRRRKEQRRKKESKENERAERKQRRQHVRRSRRNLRSSQLSEEAWETRLQEAFEKEDYDQLEELFLLNLLSCVDRDNDASISISRRYRVLSSRFHPDKQRDAAMVDRHKITFQALNEAHQVSREHFA